MRVRHISVFHVLLANLKTYWYNDNIHYVCYRISYAEVWQVENRNVRKSKKAIEDAVLSLIELKPYQSISVREILDEADICRSTFYKHYRDIYDLIDTIELKFLDELKNECMKLNDYKSVEGKHPIIESVFTVVQKNDRLIRLLLGGNGDLAFIYKIEDLLRGVCITVSAERQGRSTDDRQVLLYSSYVVSGAVGIYLQKMAMDISCGPDELGYLIGEMFVKAENVFFD